MLRNLILVLMAATTLLSLTLLSVHLLRRDRPPPHPSDTVLTVEQVRSLATLVTTRVTVHSELSISVRGYLGELTVRWSGPGSVLLGPDLEKTRIIHRDDAHRTATVVLPEPAILERTLDLGHGEIEGRFEGIWQASPDPDLLSTLQQRVLTKAQLELPEAVTDDHRAASRQTAEQAAQRLGESIGWIIDLQWQRPESAPAAAPDNGTRRPGEAFCLAIKATEPDPSQPTGEFEVNKFNAGLYRRATDSISGFWISPCAYYA